MKKSIKIFISLLAFIFFVQVCFANYTINPEVQKSITEYAEKRITHDKMNKDQRRKARTVIILIALLGLVVVGVVFVVLLGEVFEDMFEPQEE